MLHFKTLHTAERLFFSRAEVVFRSNGVVLLRRVNLVFGLIVLVRDQAWRTVSVESGMIVLQINYAF